ncbi:MAG: hypothetical protein A3K03_12040 [Bdellovibrionales bacterium RIFOXYD1_FULL_44_7]|nr:MAG: hypothetical protein A3K03_12040 [Bdellovibrionales bacterium RIFOXYD1_FULL_44_7]
MASALKFKHTNVSRQQGEYARLKVVQGPDFGTVFVFIGVKVSVGRGEDNDAVVSDLKASRKHAEFVLTGGWWEVKDAGSANGILHNGRAVKSAVLKAGDSITLGETTFEFLPSDAGTVMLQAPARSISQIQTEQDAFASQQKKIRSIAMFGGTVSTPHASGGAGVGLQGLLKNKKVLLVLAAVAVALFLFDSPEQKPKKSAGKIADKGSPRDLASFLPPDPAAGKTAEMFFKAGFREYRERNYLRAISQFETVLQMAPSHSLAQRYLNSSKKAIENEVKEHLTRGKRDMDAGKLRAAKGHFEAVQRLLYHDQSNVSFVEAKEQADKVYKLISGGGAS